MELFAKDPVLRNSHHFYDMPREEKIENAYAKTARMVEILPEDLTYTNILYFTTMNLGACTNNLHHAMFELAIRYLGDEE